MDSHPTITLHATDLLGVDNLKNLIRRGIPVWIEYRAVFFVPISQISLNWEDTRAYLHTQTKYRAQVWGAMITHLMGKSMKDSGDNYYDSILKQHEGVESVAVRQVCMRVWLYV